MHAEAVGPAPIPHTAAIRRHWWWGFAVFAVASIAHVVVLIAQWGEAAQPTKLLLMPALALGVLWGGRGSAWGLPYTLTFLAIALSWLGDGAAFFFPDAPTLPVMLACFGAAHICYIWLFQRHLAVRPLPRWSAIYAVWWVALLAILLPVLVGGSGGIALALAVAAYGIVLGGTAASAARCHPAIVAGGAFFLASDTLLAFRLFTPEVVTASADAVVMLLYCLGQGLIAVGVVLSARGSMATK